MARNTYSSPHVKYDIAPKIPNIIITAHCFLLYSVDNILHPNNIGRCGHICNASYAVSSSSRGLHIGEKLVLDCLEQGKTNGFGA